MKYAIRLISFALALALTLLAASHVLRFKFDDGIYPMTKFYEQEPETVDLLILGSSHAYENINTGLLWEEQGISSYLLCGARQPLWNTYYCLLEALKTQTPKLIILEAYMCTAAEEYSEDSYVIKNTFGLKLNANRISSIQVSVPEERWEEFLLAYYQYHNRYTDLSRADFAPNLGNPQFADWKGFTSNSQTAAYYRPELTAADTRFPLSEKSEEYLRKIIELTAERNIPFMLIVTPYVGISEYDQWKYNTVSDIAAEYGVPFLNFNSDSHYDAIDLDFTVDFADLAHMNYRGNEKFTRYLCRYLTGYQLPDHREDRRYDSWRRDAKFLAQIVQNQTLSNCYNSWEALELVKNDNYQLYVTFDGNCDTSEWQILGVCEVLDIEPDGKAGTWFRDNRDGTVWWSGEGENVRYFQPDNHTNVALMRLSDGYGGYISWIVVDNYWYKQTGNGVTFVVYDTVTESIVTAFGLDKALDYQMVRG